MWAQGEIDKEKFSTLDNLLVSYVSRWWAVKERDTGRRQAVLETGRDWLQVLSRPAESEHTGWRSQSLNHEQTSQGLLMCPKFDLNKILCAAPYLLRKERVSVTVLLLKWRRLLLFTEAVFLHLLFLWTNTENFSASLCSFQWLLCWYLGWFSEQRVKAGLPGHPEISVWKEDALVSFNKVTQRRWYLDNDLSWHNN